MGEGEERVVCKSCSLEAEAVAGLFHVISKRRREEGTWSSHGHILSGEGCRFILSQAQECPGGGFKQGSQSWLQRDASLPVSFFSQPLDGSSSSVSSLWPAVFTGSHSAYTASLSWEVGAGTHTISQTCNWGPFQPQLLINSVQLHPQILSLHSWVQGLGYQGGHGSCSHRLRASNLQPEPHGFPSRTHRNDATFLLLGQSSLLSEPKGAGSLSWFQNLRFLLRGNELPSFIPPMFSERFLWARLWSIRWVYSREQNRKKQSLP